MRSEGVLSQVHTSRDLHISRQIALFYFDRDILFASI